VLQVLVDADNVAPRRVQAVLDLLPVAAQPVDARHDVRVVAAGHPAALAELRLPAYAEILPSAGWQRADVALAAAYTPDDGPLVVVSGDGDFGLLAGRHSGPVLVVSGAASSRLRDVARVLDPVVDGVGAVRDWLVAVDSGSADG
jgi:hypothetical protein